MLLYLLGWVASLVQLLIATICLGAGMYYMAEVVEECTVMARQVITIMLYAVTVILIGLFALESFPLYVIAPALASHVGFYLLLKTFPFISFTSPGFIVSVVFIFVHHYFSLQHFADVWYPFSEVMAYATLCLWLLPLAFFVSLSANDNVLPTSTPTSSSDSSGDVHGFPQAGNKSRRNGFRAFVDAMFSYLPSRDKTF